MLLRVLVAIVIAGHGFAHLAGFAVSWRLLTSADMPYHTTILRGALNLGGAGMRLFGLLWIAAGLALVVVALMLVSDAPNWWRVALAAVAGSVAITFLELPYARVGFTLNLGLLALVVSDARWAWLIG